MTFWEGYFFKDCRYAVQTDWDCEKVSGVVVEGGIGSTYDFNAGTQWLLAEDVETQLDSFDGLIGMNGGSTGNDDCLKTPCFLFPQHLVIVFVESDSLQGSGCPNQLFLVRRRGCH